MAQRQAATARTPTADGIMIGDKPVDKVIPPRLRHRRASFPLSLQEGQEEPKLLQVANDSDGPVPIKEIEYHRSVTRRNSFHGMRSLRGVEFTLLHELRAYFDATYRLNMVRERLRAVSEEKGLSAEDMFSLVDTDQSGEIDAQELGAMVSLLGVRLKKIDLETLMTLIDKSGNGECDVDEFRLWLTFRNKDITGRRRDKKDEYNDVNLLKRESLKYHPKMMAVMDTWWKLVDSDLSGSISCEEYVKLHLNLQRAIVHQKSFDVARARRLALQEWEFDSQGMREMDKNLFILSFFQMADAWRTGKIAVESYTGFMDMLQQRMTFQEPGKKALHWAWERDILWDVHLWEKAVAEKPKRITILQRAIQDARKNRKPKDLEDAMRMGDTVSVEHLKEFLPQQLVEAALRQKESRVQNRSWLDGPPNLQVRRRTTVVQAAVEPKSGDGGYSSDNQRRTAMSGVEPTAKSRKNHKDTVAWAERLHGKSKQKRDRAQGGQSSANRTAQHQRAGQGASPMKASILDVLDQVQTNTIDELDTDDDQSSSSASAAVGDVALESAAMQAGNSVPVRTRTAPRPPLPKGQSFSPQPIPQSSEQQDQVYTYHHLRRPETPDSDGRPVTPVNISLGDQGQDAAGGSRPGSPGTSGHIVHQYLRRPFSPGGRPWTPERRAVMESMMHNDGLIIPKVDRDADDEEGTRDSAEDADVLKIDRERVAALPARGLFDMWVADAPEVPPAQGMLPTQLKNLAFNLPRGQLLMAQNPPPGKPSSRQTETAAKEVAQPPPPLRRIRRSRLGHCDPWDVFESHQAEDEDNQGPESGKRPPRAGKDGEDAPDHHSTVRGDGPYQGHLSMSPIVPRRRKQEGTATRPSTLESTPALGHAQRTRQLETRQRHHLTEDVDEETKELWAASERVFQHTGALPPPSFFRYMEVGASSPQLVMHGSHMSVENYGPQRAPSSRADAAEATSLPNQRASKPDQEQETAATEGFELDAETRGGQAWGSRSQGNKSRQAAPGQAATLPVSLKSASSENIENSAGLFGSGSHMALLPETSRTRGVFQGNAAFQHTTAQNATLTHHPPDVPATREDMNRLRGMRSNEYEGDVTQRMQPLQPRSVQAWSYGEEPWITKSNRQQSEVLALAKQRPFSAISKTEALRKALMQTTPRPATAHQGPAHLPATRASTKNLVADVRARSGGSGSAKLPRPKTAGTVRQGLAIRGATTKSVRALSASGLAAKTAAPSLTRASTASRLETPESAKDGPRSSPFSLQTPVSLNNHVSQSGFQLPRASPFHSSIQHIQCIDPRARRITIIPSSKQKQRPATAPLRPAQS